MALGGKRALDHLRKDPKMAAVIARVGTCRLVVSSDGTHFAALVRSIVYQQLSGKAAATIHGRVRALTGGRDPTPAELLALDLEVLRAAGLSRQKASYVLDLAANAAALEGPAVSVEQVSRAVQGGDGLAGARAALDHQDALQPGPDDPVLFGLDGGYHVPHPAGAAGAHRGQQSRLAGQPLPPGGVG